MKDSILGPGSPVRAAGLACCVIAWLTGTASAAPTLDELRAAIRRHRQAFEAQQSYKFEFQVDSEVYRGKQPFATKTLTVTEVRRGPDLSALVRIPKGAIRVANGSDESQEMTMQRVFFKGAAIDTNGFLMEISPNVLVQHFQNHQYTDYQHINVYSKLPAPSGNLAPYETTQPFLPEMLDKFGKSYRVRGAPEDLEGTPCWVIERPGMDVIWVDDDGLIRKRLLYWGEGLPRSIETTLSDYKAVAAGLKLPMKIFVQHFTNPHIDTKDIWDQVSYDLKITLKSHEFNAAKDQDFMVKAPQGGMVNDYIRRVQYRVPGPNEKPFERAIEMASLEQPSRSQVIILANGVLLGLLLVVILWRRIRSLRSMRVKASRLDEPIGTTDA